MNYYQMKYFQIAAEEENLTKAAQKVNLSQQALSSSIASLEKELDLKLFDRAGRKVSLNNNGKIVLSHVNIILKEYADMFEELDQQNNTFTKALHIGTTSTNAHKGILTDFLSKNDDIRINIFYVNEETINSSLEKANTDFIISCEPINNLNAQSFLLFEERFYLAVSEYHPFANKESITLEETQECAFALSLPGNVFRNQFEKACRTVGFRPKIILETDIEDTIILSVRNNMAVSVVVTSGIKSYEEKNCKTIPIVNDFAKRPIYLVWRKNNNVSEQWKRFYDFVSNTLPSSHTLL